MQTIINLAATIAIALGMTYGLPKAAHMVKMEALKKVKQGLPPMTPMAEKLTGKKQSEWFK